MPGNPQNRKTLNEKSTTKKSLLVGDGAAAVLDGLDEGGFRFGAVGADFGDGDFVLDAFEFGVEFVDEGLHVFRVADELAHVVDDDAAFSLGLDVALAEAAMEEGDDDGERGSVDLRDEGRAHERVESLRVFFGVRVRRNQGRHERLHVRIVDDGAALAQRRLRGRLDLRLGVPHAFRDFRHHFGQQLPDLRRRRVRQHAQQFQAPRLHLPGNSLHALKEERQQRRRRVRVHALEVRD
mmetsp:Transcript_14078/g.42578  ORF Transcript_14078/g.42578 Transcript_14078/m.42578 type:complete len:238 (+) Transcript_14078:321-1034(+)